MKSCLVAECKNKVTCRGYCGSHYQTIWYKSHNPEKFKANRDKQHLTPKYRFTAYKSKPGIKEKWHLTLEQFKELIKPECYYCNGFFGRSTKGCGLDRLDSSKGYTVDNVVSCCRQCNIMKNEFLSVDETKVLVKTLIALRTEGF